MLLVDNLANVFALLAALSWGAGDFVGGCATRRTNAYSAVMATQLTGIIMFPVLALAFSENLPSLNNLMWGGLAGFFGASGLILLYMSMARGKMSIVVTLAAIIAIIIPVIYSAINEGIPDTFKIAGFILALIGIWFIVRMNAGLNLENKDVEYIAVAGILFGLFFISIDKFSSTGIYWPLTFSRITALIMLTGFMMLTKASSKPTSDAFLLVILAGILNTGGVVLFALASVAGRLDVATILSSLSPAVTVLLACIILKEQLAPRQWVGVIASITAIVLISM
ncbi:DMT family transporter [Methanolobus vulcani]|uniref:DMT family transporter n=1 Tax=Methanolobus vulcani TaxID=38026 RepID=A0A7Z8P2B8_9EURY|nr:DMT family transporter [Methanolobus vulcani]TQD25652.1 DMT family transporter [Methanolobus vulcani]